VIVMGIRPPAIIMFPTLKRNLVNKTNLLHNFSCMFVSILYMFRATMCPSSGEITVSMRHLVFITVWMTVWYAGWDFIPSCIPDGHPHRVINTRCRIHPSMALQPLPGLGLPHKTPPAVSVRRSSPPFSYPQQM
jgi:hypothetical protein